MIRTDIVHLTTIPAAAYRQKLPAGGAGIVIIRSDSKQPAIASISKTSGQAIPAANTPKNKFPDKAFQEAVELTANLPYTKRRPPSKVNFPSKEKAAPEIEALEIIIDSDEYQKIVDMYTDKKGRLSYALLNKDLIQFTHYSSVARSMIAQKASLDEICLYAVGTKFRGITGNPRLTDEQVLKMVELLDEVSPKGVLTEFRDELRRSLK